MYAIVSTWYSLWNMSELCAFLSCLSGLKHLKRPTATGARIPGTNGCARLKSCLAAARWLRTNDWRLGRSCAWAKRPWKVPEKAQAGGWTEGQTGKYWKMLGFSDVLFVLNLVGWVCLLGMRCFLVFDSTVLRQGFCSVLINCRFPMNTTALCCYCHATPFDPKCGGMALEFTTESLAGGAHLFIDS